MVRLRDGEGDAEADAVVMADKFEEGERVTRVRQALARKRLFPRFDFEIHHVERAGKVITGAVPWTAENEPDQESLRYREQLAGLARLPYEERALANYMAHKEEQTSGKNLCAPEESAGHPQEVGVD
jgi:hypothetical protein